MHDLNIQMCRPFGLFHYRSHFAVVRVVHLDRLADWVFGTKELGGYPFIDDHGVGFVQRS